MTTSEIRKLFLEHMKQNGHSIIPSAKLTPENDPTTLFTGSGMQPMLPYLLGEKHPLGVRIADSQKCFRSQDIEEVGDNRHTTFFEMLGNWSLGDFFKEKQIPIMWSFLTDKLHIDPSRLYFTCFEGNEALGIPRDTVSANLWINLYKGAGIEAHVNENPETLGIREGDRIFYYSEKKNWWSRSGVPANMPVGEPGGPDTEMFYDFHPELGRSCIPDTPFSGEFCHVNCDCGRFMEIGNNVFMEYIKTNSGFEKLAQANVDFGGGLERLAAALNNSSDVFTIDIFKKPIDVIEHLSGIKYGIDTKNTYAIRVILDHIRAATFLIGDDVLPGNKDQSYFVRRLIRRSVRFARTLGIQTNFTREVAEAYIDIYKDEYSILDTNRETILSELEKEETKFRKTLENGLKELDKLVARLGNTKRIESDDAFNLYQSYGFPIEIIEEIIKEKGGTVDLDGFEKKKQEHADSSRTASVGKFKGGLGGDSDMEVKYHTATHLLNEALRKVLGDHVMQKGSNITPERLRFDFSHSEKMTPEQINAVEKIVNSEIQADLPVLREELSYEEARARGAIGVFDAKYGERVSIYKIGTGESKNDPSIFSIEFCGGPHVEHTGVLGTFKITKEESVSAGVRRIKATLT